MLFINKYTKSVAWIRIHHHPHSDVLNRPTNTKFHSSARLYLNRFLFDTSEVIYDNNSSDYEINTILPFVRIH